MDPRLSAALDAAHRRLVASHGLTARESDVVAAALGEISRRSFLETRGISADTYRAHVRSALKKLGARSLDEVRESVLRELSK